MSLYILTVYIHNLNLKEFSGIFKKNETVTNLLWSLLGILTDNRCSMSGSRPKGSRTRILEQSLGWSSRQLAARCGGHLFWVGGWVSTHLKHMRKPNWLIEMNQGSGGENRKCWKPPPSFFLLSQAWKETALFPPAKTNMKPENTVFYVFFETRNIYRPPILGGSS